MQQLAAAAVRDADAVAWNVVQVVDADDDGVGVEVDALVDVERLRG